MKVDVKKLERGEIELTIELTEEEYQPFLQVAAKKISENTKINGFRPGKANFELIEKHVGKNEVWQQALEPAVVKTFVKALDQEKLITVGSPHIDVVKLAPGNPVIYKATVAILPKVELGDFEKKKIAKNKVAVPDEQIEKSMQDLRKMRAKEILSTEKIKEGNKAEIDFELFLDKIPVDNGKQEKFSLVIGEKSFIPGFEKQLLGLGGGDEKKFQLEFPKNYHQKNLAGRLVDFKVKINAVYTMELPELNDALAKSMGDFKTIKEIRDQITESLQIEAEQKENQRVEEEIINNLIESSKFDNIPDILISSETQKMIQELEHNIGHQGLSFEDYLSHLKKTRQDLLLDFAPQALKRMKSALALRKVREQANIEVTPEEVDDEIKKTLASYGGNPEIEQQITTPNYKSYLKNIIASRKTIEHLKGRMVQ